jgi:hypothetical protein
MKETERFAYLREVAQRYGQLYFKRDCLSVVATIDKTRLSELQLAYDSIVEQNDAKDLS